MQYKVKHEATRTLED